MAQTHTSMYMPKIQDLAEWPEGLADAWKFYLETVGLGNCVGRGRYYHQDSCEQCLGTRPMNFAAIVNKTLADDARVDEVMVCEICRKPHWKEASHTDINDTVVCDDCRNNLGSCDSCGDWSISAYFLTHIGWDTQFCEHCRDEQCSFCNDCDTWYHDNNSDDHDHEPDYCRCEPHPHNFQILANSHGTLKQDERLLIELAHGFIPDEAINAVIGMLWSDQLRGAYYQGLEGGERPTATYEALTRTVESMDREWQTKRGNFTRRLSAALYKELGVKLEPGLLSKAGSRIREHAGSTSKWYVEFTRDLNQSPEAFYHDGSCWWGSENDSLCALKHWGGIGMRSYETETQSRDCPSGRVWVQPLNTDLRPTLDVFGAHAYVVYNGYGQLDGYTAARLVAYLTSRTYKKIDFEASYQYINSGGFLVADQETCNMTSSIEIDGLGTHERVAA